MYEFQAKLFKPEHLSSAQPAGGWLLHFRSTAMLKPAFVLSRQSPASIKAPSKKQRALRARFSSTPFNKFVKNIGTKKLKPVERCGFNYVNGQEI